MSREQRYILIILAAISAVLILIHPQKESLETAGSIVQNDILEVSKDSGFYDEEFVVYANDSAAVEVYYTLDGSEPGKENEKSQLMTKRGVEIPCGEAEQVYNLKCRSYYEDGSYSKTVCKSYITGENVLKRYDLPVLNVFGDPEEFYNYENGIMTHGKMDDAYIAEHMKWIEEIEANVFPVYGNRYQQGRESEKEVNITLFDEKGNVLFAQNGGFRVYGGYSRSKNQPSFRLYARSEYDELNEFDHILFENQYNEDGTVLLDKFKRLIVRNNGNDNGYAFIRNELSLRLAIDAGFLDAQASRPVCVYLNGEYYGILWLMTNYDDEYFKEKYGEYQGEMYVFEGSVDQLKMDEEEDEAYIDLVKEYNEKQAYFADCDLSNEDNWNALNAFMDVENFLQYSAIQHYVANWDTFKNNYKVYRYYNAEGDYTEDSVFDGKYRFLLFDLDYSLGLIEYHHYVEAVAARLTSERAKGEAPQDKLFANILTREDCREIYIRYFLACMNYYYSESYVTPILEKMHEERYDELAYGISQGLYLDNFCAEDVTSMADVEMEMEEIRQFLRERPGNAVYDLVLAFGTLTPYTLNLQNESGAMVQIDYADVTAANFSGIYLEELPPVLRARAKVGEKFAYWIVNGEKIQKEELIIDSSMIQDYMVDVICVCEKDEEISIKISEVRPKGGNDYVELTNFGQERINLRNYALSDSDGERKSVLPNIFLSPGESLIVYCKNYTGLEALGQVGVNFNVSAGEVVSLYKGTDEVDSVKIPRLGSKGSVFGLNQQTGKFQEVIP